MSGDFAAVFTALYVAHSVGDHWVQSDTQARCKGLEGWDGRAQCAAHVGSLTLTKALVLWLVVAVLGIDVSVLGAALGLGIDAVSHYWADRRTTLYKLAKLTRKAVFYNMGTGARNDGPINYRGKPAVHLGTGAYALDQSFHHAFLLVAALLIVSL